MMRPPNSDNDPVGPVVQPPQFAPPTGTPREGEAPLITQPVGRHRHTTRRLVVAGIAVVALGAVTAIVVTRRSGSDEGNSSAGTVATTEVSETSEVPDDPRDASAADAHVAYLAGQCAEVVSLYEPLLADADWVASSDAAEQAQFAFDECTDLLAIAQGTGTPADQLAAYLAFLDARPGTPLEPAVVVELQAVYQSAGAFALTMSNCDAIGDDFTLLTTTAVGAAMLGCAELYAVGGRTGDASALAIDSLEHTDDTEMTFRAVTVAVADPYVCESLAGGVRLVDFYLYPAQHGALLQGCMTAAFTAGDLGALASLQIQYLVDVPEQAAATEVEAALIANDGACDLLWTMRETPELTSREGFIVSKTFKCAELAFYVGDTSTAIELYQWFLDNDSDGDPRTAVAEAGLAWNQIAEARAEGAVEWDNPTRAGSVDSSITRMIIRNDANSKLTVTITGPETRVVVIAESPTSSPYPIGGPIGCRTDTPSVTLDLIPGQYEVMFERSNDPFAVGSWTLRAGTLYDFCLYVVRY